MPDRAPAPPSPRSPDPEVLARRARVEARSSMPPWVALLLLAACLLAVNVFAGLFRSSGDAIDDSVGRVGTPPVVVEEPVRDPG